MKILKGEVISILMKKTIIVKINKLVKNFRYNKYFYRIKKYYVHDEYNLSSLGDVVEFFFYKPISKNKF